MLSLITARALRDAGLTWKPAEFDFFGIPDRGMDERVFVVSSMPAMVGQIQGQTMVAFEGAVEWALDYVPAGEVVWLPTEEQLHTELMAWLATEPALAPESAPVLRLAIEAERSRCEIAWGGQTLSFAAASAGDAYAAALLHVLHQAGTLH